MAIVYVTTGAWGTGTGVPNPAATIDGNFYDLDQRVQDLVDNPPVAAGISNIQVNGSQLMIFLSNGAEFGPFTLPVAAIQFKGEYVPTTQYFELDVVSVLGQGIFLVRIDHEGPDPFNPDLLILGEPAYVKIFGDDPYRYDFGLFIPGEPGSGFLTGERIFSHIVVADVFIEEDAPGSQALLEVAPADGDLIFPIYQDVTQVGTITFPDTETIGVFEITGGVQLASGERFSIIRPNTLDTAARELTVTFAARRGIMP